MTTDSSPAVPEAAIEAAAEASHVAYEDAAIRHGWKTQERSRVPWADVPEANKATVRDAMGAALAAALPHMGTGQSEADLRAQLELAERERDEAQAGLADTGFKSVAEVVRGYWSLDREFQKACQSRADLRARISALADEWASRVDEAYDYGMQLRALLDRPAAAGDESGQG